MVGKRYNCRSRKGIGKILFEEVKVKRVYAKHAAGNPNSGSVMQKMGMKKEGIIRQSGTCNQVLWMKFIIPYLEMSILVMIIDEKI